MDYKVAVKVSGPLLSGQGAEAVQKQLEAFIVSTTMYILPRVKARTPQGVYGAQGGLLGSIQADFPGKGTPLVKGVIATAQMYGEPVEKGRTPGKGMPPKGTLVRWLEVKLGLDRKSAERIEYVVRRKIGRKGFAGARMFEQGLAEHWPWVEANAQRHGLEIARELNG